MVPAQDAFALEHVVLVAAVLQDLGPMGRTAWVSGLDLVASVDYVDYADSSCRTLLLISMPNLTCSGVVHD